MFYLLFYFSDDKEPVSFKFDEIEDINKILESVKKNGDNILDMRDHGFSIPHRYLIINLKLVLMIGVLKDLY
jgi:hypothetical protein